MNWAGTLIGCLFMAFLYTSSAQNAISNFEGISAVFVGAGGMIGTMLALVLTLSMAPLQRAAEVFTWSILRQYRNDAVSLLIFLLLSLFCMASFVLGARPVIGTHLEKVVPLELLVIGLSLDLLRWHHRHVVDMLTPGVALNRLLKAALRFVVKSQRRILRLSKMNYATLTEKQKKDESSEIVESALYAAHPEYTASIKSYLDQIAEIVQKAVSRKETSTATAGISKLVRIALEYLNQRKDNIIPLPSPEAHFLSPDTDASPVLTPVYEHLQDINRFAVSTNEEGVAIQVILAFGQIAAFTSTLKVNFFRDGSVLLTFAPIYYLRECVRSALARNLNDVALQAGRSLSHIGRIAPDNVDPANVHIPLIDALCEIAEQFLVAGKVELANVVLTELMSLLHHLLDKKYYPYRLILGEVLDKLPIICILAIGSTKVKGESAFGLSLAPYDPTSQVSLGYLVGRAAQLIKKDDSEWVNPYHDFIEVNKSICGHFRNLAEKINFQGTFLLWHLTQTIKHIAGVYLWVLEQNITDDPHIGPLVDEIPWYSAFFWVVFENATIEFSHQRAEEACDVLAWIGLQFYLRHYDSITGNSIENIYSIIESYSKHSPEPYGLADLFIYLWQFHILAEHENDRVLLQKVDNKIASKPEAVDANLWKLATDALETRKRQLAERLREPERYLVEEDAKAVLREILSKPRSVK